MRSLQLVRQAALENARWCDLVCRAHGLPVELGAAWWLARSAVPPHYPRFVSLGGPERAGEHRAAVRALVDAAPGEPFAAKDSFHALDLAPLGFSALFEAEWICALSGRAAPADAGPIRWSQVREEGALAAWEAACGGSPPPGGRAAARVFPAALLREPGLVFLAGEREGRIVGTGVLHRSEEVVGLSNVTGDAAAAFPACMAAAAELFPGLPVVGYEHGPELEAALAAGFTRLGPLTVWERRPEEGATQFA